jgi:hypothetical protein
LSQDAFLEILPQNAALHFRKIPRQDWIGSLPECQDKNWLLRLEIIPYASVGINDVLLGFRPDKAVIFDKDAKITLCEVVVAVAGTTFGDDGFCALLHPALFNSAENVEGETVTCVLAGR